VETPPLTFAEFEALGLPGRLELVNGRVEELAPVRPLHGSTTAQLLITLGTFVQAHHPEAYLGNSVDIPTVPYSGRRPDIVYYSSADRSRLDLKANRVLGVPTLVVEVLSEEDEARDLVVKRAEYAEAGIPHYWILDPRRRTVLTLALDGGAYRVVGELSGEDTLTSDLFPGLAIPLTRVFHAG